MRTLAIRIHRHGGAEQLEPEEISIPAPGSGEVIVRNTAIGVNYADIYERTGDPGGPHASRQLPITPGHMAAGQVETVGPDVAVLRPGMRVGYIGGDAYAGHTRVAANRLLHLPDNVSDDVIGGYLLRGLTAEYLLRRLFPVKPGTVALVHAAAGGMGLILGQWGALLGARMIGTVSTPEKAEIARAHGYTDLIDYASEDFAARTMELTGGKGADVIYDGVGKATFRKSLDCVRARGMVISYGTASGNVGAFDLQLLHARSIIVTRPTLRSWIAEPHELQDAARALFDVLGGGKIRTPISARLPLADAAEAHRRLESRGLEAPLILIP
ncbi:MAG: quinone oxidoreductase family protein [Roseinatronobacter sp.]